MGMFDTVHVPCPSCDEDVEIQSKGGKCILADYQWDDVPVDVAIYVNGDTTHCQKCNHNFKVQMVPPMPPTVMITLEEIIKDENE